MHVKGGQQEKDVRVPSHPRETLVPSPDNNTATQCDQQKLWSSRDGQPRIVSRTAPLSHPLGDNKHEAASAYVDAANCYKKFLPHDAAEALNNAVNLFIEIGRLNMAARYSKDIDEIYEEEQDLRMLQFT